MIQINRYRLALSKGLNFGHYDFFFFSIFLIFSAIMPWHSFASDDIRFIIGKFSTLLPLPLPLLLLYPMQRYPLLVFFFFFF